MNETVDPQATLRHALGELYSPAELAQLRNGLPSNAALEKKEKKRPRPRPPVKPGSMSQMVLLAAASLEAKTFTLETLTVQAWVQWPNEVFGLKGYESDFPNPNLVSATLCGKRGLVARGLMKRIAPRVYCVTQLGRAVAQGG